MSAFQTSMPFLKPQSVDSEITGECDLPQSFDSSEQHAFQQAISILSQLISRSIMRCSILCLSGFTSNNT
jgi:hypothetical protein